MSDTKWRKAFRAIAEARLGVREMLVKFIDVDGPRRMRFPPSLACPLPYMDTIEFGPTELRSIEWLEVGPTSNRCLRRLASFRSRGSIADRGLLATANDAQYETSVRGLVGSICG